MASLRFDTDRFIIEVQQRPAIWDIRCKEYGNKFIKGKAWEGLCLIFIPNFQEMDVALKNKAAADLQRKWKSCRDSFRRELLKKSKSGSVAESGRKQYVYFKQLEFLLPICETKPASLSPQTECPADDEVEERNTGDTLPSCPPSSSIRPQKRKRTAAIEEQALLQTIAKYLEKKAQERNEDDGDKHFLLSLLPHFRTLPDALKLEVQGDFINVLQRYKQRAVYMSQPPPTQLLPPANDQLYCRMSSSITATAYNTPSCAHTLLNKNSGSYATQQPLHVQCPESAVNSPDTVISSISESSVCEDFF